MAAACGCGEGAGCSPPGQGVGAVAGASPSWQVAALPGNPPGDLPVAPAGFDGTLRAFLRRKRARAREATRVVDTARLALGFSPDPVDPLAFEEMEQVAWSWEPPVLGLHGLHAGECADDRPYAGPGEQFLDARRLGARLCRQWGVPDLTWKDTSGDAAVPTSSAGIWSLVLTDENVERVGTALVEARRNGIKLVLRIGDSGGGDADRSGSVADPSGLDATIAWAWEPGWEDILRDAGVDNPRLDTLDLRQPLKVAALAETCAAAAALLREAHRWAILELGRAFYLDTAVLGIEVFNEIEVCNVRVGDDGRDDTEATAQDWANAHFECARAFLREFGWESTSFPGFMMAGMHSTEVENDTHRISRARKLVFMRKFLRHLRELCREARIDPEKLLAARDLHWYHGATGDKTDGGDPGRDTPLHVVHLVDEVYQVRDVLDDEGFEWVELTVLESGVSVSTEWGPRVPEEYGKAADVDDDQAQAVLWERFQAHEVWRRLLGALAAGAFAAGWTSFIGAAAYRGHGLRRDLHFDGSGVLDPEANAAFTAAMQRPAWFAYERLAALLVGAVGVRMVLPALSLPTGYTLPAELESSAGWSWCDSAVVFEITGAIDPGTGSVYPVAYVLLLDPAAPDTRTTVAVAPVDLATGVVIEPRWTRLAWAPAATVLASAAVDPGGCAARRYELQVALYAGAGPAAGGFVLERGNDPVVLLAERRVGWVSCA